MVLPYSLYWIVSPVPAIYIRLLIAQLVMGNLYDSRPLHQPEGMVPFVFAKARNTP